MRARSPLGPGRAIGQHTRAEARRRALLAAARVAFLTTAGCATEPSSSAPPPATPPPATSVATGPGGCALPSSDTPSEKEIACCTEGASKVAGDRAGTDDGPDSRAPAPIVACCTRVVLYRDRTRSSPHFDSCCAVLGRMSGACTPWGPPMPPRMTATRPARLA